MEKDVYDLFASRSTSFIEGVVLRCLDYYFKHNKDLLIASLQASQPARPPTNDLLNTKEGMAYLRCSRATLYRLVQSGELAYIKRGRTTLFKREDLDHVLKKRTLKRC